MMGMLVLQDVEVSLIMGCLPLLAEHAPHHMLHSHAPVRKLLASPNQVTRSYTAAGISYLVKLLSETTDHTIQWTLCLSYNFISCDLFQDKDEDSGTALFVLLFGILSILIVGAVGRRFLGPMFRVLYRPSTPEVRILGIGWVTLTTACLFSSSIDNLPMILLCKIATQVLCS